MAYMTNQWLKSNPQRQVFHYPVSVGIKDWVYMDNFNINLRTETMPEAHDTIDLYGVRESAHIVFTLELEKEEEAGHGYGEELKEEVHHKIYFTQSDVEFLLKSLLLKTSRDIKLETKLELIKLINMNYKEAMKYIHENYQRAEE